MNKNIGSKLRELRDQLGYDIGKLAELMQVDAEIVEQWESGDIIPNKEDLHRLAEIFDVDYNELCENKVKTNIDVDLPFLHIKIGGDKMNDSDWFDTNANAEANDENSKSYTVYENDTVHVTRKKVVTGTTFFLKFPYPLLVLIAFFVNLFVLEPQINHFWLIFLTIPIYYWFAAAVAFKRIPTISVSGLIVIAYLVMGFCFQLWHPGWIIFLTIPIFDFLFSYFFKKKK